MTIEEKALKLKQEIGITTMFSKDNSGYSLSELTSTKIAIKTAEFFRENKDLNIDELIDELIKQVK